MKESDRKFEKLLKEAVCSYHKEEMDALPSEEELQDIQLSDDFYRKMDGLVKNRNAGGNIALYAMGQLRQAFCCLPSVRSERLLMHLWERRISKHSLKTCKRIPCRRQCGDGSGTADRHGCDNRRYSLRGR